MVPPGNLKTWGLIRFTLLRKLLSIVLTYVNELEVQNQNKLLFISCLSCEKQNIELKKKVKSVNVRFFISLILFLLTLLPNFDMYHIEHPDLSPS